MLPGPPRPLLGQTHPQGPRRSPRLSCLLPRLAKQQALTLGVRGSNRKRGGHSWAGGGGSAVGPYLLQRNALSTGGRARVRVHACVCTRVPLQAQQRGQRMREGAVSGETSFNHSTFSSASSQGDPQEEAQVVLRGAERWGNPEHLQWVPRDQPMVPPHPRDGRNAQIGRAHV